VCCVAFSPDGSLLISKSGDTVFIFDSKKGLLRTTFATGHAASMDIIQCSADGSLIASLSPRDGSTRLWGYRSLREALLTEVAVVVPPIPLHAAPPKSLDAETLAVAAPAVLPSAAS
jgi:hypothetical protein